MTLDAGLHVGDLDAASRCIPVNKPYIMMNMVKFNPVAQYTPTFQGPRPASNTGRDAYDLYKTAFAGRAMEMGISGIELIFVGQAHTNLVAGQHEGEAWDLVLLVKFPDFATFRSVLEDEIYKKDVEPHRLAAARDLRSFAITELST